MRDVLETIDGWCMIAGPRPDAGTDWATTRRLTDGTRVFVESFAAPPRMLVFGAIDFAGAPGRSG